MIKLLMERWLALLTIAVLAFSAACTPQAEDEIPVDKPTTVRVLQIEARDLPVAVEAVGRITPNREVTLSAEVGGTVAGYRTDVGHLVKTGQVLVEFDPVDFRLALNEAEANLAAAQARLYAAAKAFDRSKTLLPRQVISPDSFEKIEAEYKAAQADLSRAKAGVDLARERLAKTRVTAPFPGLVAARMIEIGQTGAPGQPLMTIVDLNPVRVRVYLAERDYVDLDRQDPVAVTVEAFPGREFPARIDVICIQADSRTNTFCLEVLVDNPDLLLKAGLTARVRAITRIIPQAVLAPQSAVLYRGDKTEVFVVGPGRTAERREVKLGRTEGSLVQITENLNPGDRLVTAGQQYLKPGDKIIIAADDRS